MTQNIHLKTLINASDPYLPQVQLLHLEKKNKAVKAIHLDEKFRPTIERSFMTLRWSTYFNRVFYVRLTSKSNV